MDMQQTGIGEETQHVDEEIGEKGAAIDRLVTATPWWGISLGLHLVALLIFALIAVSAVEEEDDGAINVKPIADNPPHVTIDPPPPDVAANKTVDVESVSPNPPALTIERTDDVQTPDEEFARGVSGEEMTSIDPFKMAGESGIIGGGGVPGGKPGYRGRPDGNRPPPRENGGPEGSVQLALKWLARHQHADGHWGVVDYTAECGKHRDYTGMCGPNPGDNNFDCGVTGLALLAFLGAGYYHGSKDVVDGICYGKTVKNGLQWLISHQDNEGCLASRRGEYMYNHLIATLALCEAYGMSGSVLFATAAQRALDFTVAAQNEGRGWRYTYKSGDCDSSVTGWAAMALKSAELSEMAFPKSAYDGAKAWFDSVTTSDYYLVGYTSKEQAGRKVCIKGINDRYDHHEALTAIAVMSRLFIDKDRDDPKIRGGINALLHDLPAWGESGTDFYYWYYASLALFQYDGPNGPMWNQWNVKMKEALVKNQNGKPTGDKCGSWEPVDRWSCKGGRVYATAINCLTLEVYYRYACVFNGKRDK